MLLPRGITIGHAQKTNTGVTVILCDKGYVCGCDVRGGAPGTRETALLSPEKANNEVHAIALCGGSAYGLEAACGVMEYLSKQGNGVSVNNKIIPIVPAAVIFDLNDEKIDYPDKLMGYKACENATATPIFGRVGVGTGCTVGKICGIEHSSHGGVGVGSVCVEGSILTAVVAVNALGDIYEGEKIISGAKFGQDFIDTEKFLLTNKQHCAAALSNTTIGCIVTDAKLSKNQASKIAAIGHDGMARAIRPVHTDFDGDTLFCLSTGEKEVDFLALSVAATEAVRLAIINAVKSN